LWLAWDDAPRDRGEFGGPRYALGMVITVGFPDHSLAAQFACGIKLHVWRELMAPRLETYARTNNCARLEVYCRKGWLFELKNLWTFDVTLPRDPGVLYLYPSRTQSAGAAIVAGERHGSVLL
jgi:hypothetical protein